MYIVIRQRYHWLLHGCDGGQDIRELNNNDGDGYKNVT